MEDHKTERGENSGIVSLLFWSLQKGFCAQTQKDNTPELQGLGIAGIDV